MAKFSFILLVEIIYSNISDALQDKYTFTETISLIKYYKHSFASDPRGMLCMHRVKPLFQSYKMSISLSLVMFARGLIKMKH